MKLEGHLETEHQFKCDKCKVGGVMEFDKVASHLNTCREYLEAAKLNKKQNENKLPDWDAVLKSAERHFRKRNEWMLRHV